MSALNGDLLFIFNKKPNSSDAKCGDNHTAKGEDEIHRKMIAKKSKFEKLNLK